MGGWREVPVDLLRSHVELIGVMCFNLCYGLWLAEGVNVDPSFYD